MSANQSIGIDYIDEGKDKNHMILSTEAEKA